MKTIKIYGVAFLLFTLAITTVPAQSYKAQSATVDSKGTVRNYNNEVLGSISKEGVIMDESGTKIAEVNNEGILVDAKTGNKLGKAEKNGNFVYYQKPSDEALTTSPPMNGTCEVKDASGKTVVEVHENYKHLGACAFHCLSMKKERNKEMKMK